MRNRQMEMPRTHPLRKLRRLSRQMNPRLSARRIPHFNVAPTHSVPPSRAQRLHRRFFRRETRRVPLKFRLVPLAVSPLLFREHALDERLPKTPNRRFHAVNLGYVHSHPYDHLVSRIAPDSRSACIIMEALPIRSAPMPSTAKLKSPTGTRRAPEKWLKSPWRFRAAAGLKILELAPFTQFNWLIHGFSTRTGGVSILESSRPGSRSNEPRKGKLLNLGYTEWDRRERVDENRRRFAKALGNPELPLVTLRQIHSDITHIIPAAPAESDNSRKGDALATRASGLLLAIQTADCIPILLVDPRHRTVAAIHSGWRGTVARIAAKTLGRMQMEFATRPADVLAAIGPGISQCCYEVGPDVVKEFAAQFPQARSWFEGPFDALASGEDPNPLPWLTMMPPGHEPPPPRCQLDLKAANAAMLSEAGVSPKNIFVSELCTFCRPDLFFSYRREHLTGRMMSVIGIT